MTERRGRSRSATCASTVLQRRHHRPRRRRHVRRRAARRSGRRRDPPDEKNRVTLGLNVALIETGGQARAGGHRAWATSGARRSVAHAIASTAPRPLLDGLRGARASARRTSTSWSTPTCTSTTRAATRGCEDGRLGARPSRGPATSCSGASGRTPRQPHERSRASYREDDFLPLAEAGQLELVRGRGRGRAGRARGAASAATRPTTRWWWSRAAGETLVVPTDLLPTASHLPLPFVMGYDLFPVGTLEAKRTLLARRRRRAAGASSSIMTPARRSDACGAKATATS